MLTLITASIIVGPGIEMDLSWTNIPVSLLSSKLGNELGSEESLDFFRSFFQIVGWVFWGFFSMYDCSQN